MKTYYRHKKTGGTYKVLGKAKLQTSEPIVDMTEMIVYEAENGTIWCRLEHEFFDGRFEEAEK